MRDHPYQPNVRSHEDDGYITQIGKKKYRVDFSHPKMLNVIGFECPGCRSTIDPDDLTEDNYTVLGSKLDNEGNLAEIILMCNKCSSEITMYGLRVGNN